AAHWIKVMKQYPSFTSLGFTLHATGDALYVSRRNNTLEVVEAHWNEKERKRELKTYSEADYPGGRSRSSDSQRGLPASSEGTAIRCSSSWVSAPSRSWLACWWPSR